MNERFDVEYAPTHHIVIKAEQFELPLQMKFKKLGFQYQEDSVKLGNE